MEQMRRMMWEGGADLTPFGGDRDINLSLDADDGCYVAHADMPGFEKEDIDLRFDDGSLSVEASHETSDGDETSFRHQSRYVHERIDVPGDVIDEEITASYRNGVLEVRLPIRGEIEDDGDDTRIEID
jgi:HSP20 family protein